MTSEVTPFDHVVCLQALFAPVAAMLYGALLNQGLLVVPSATAADTSYLVSHPVGLWATGNKMDISTPEVIPAPPAPPTFNTTALWTLDDVLAVLDPRPRLYRDQCFVYSGRYLHR